MTEPSLAAQRAAVAAMRASTDLLALVPSANIFDRSTRPEVFPCVIVGEGSTVADEADCVIGSEVSLTVHAWVTENGLAGTKALAHAVRKALRGLDVVQDDVTLWFEFQDTVFLRDPDNAHGHAVLTFEITAEETDA